MMVRTFVFAATLCTTATLGTIALAQSAQSLPDAPSATLPVKPTPAVPTGPTVVIDTTIGRLTCKLFGQQAPLASANFIGLADGTKDWIDPATLIRQHGVRFYDGTIFHRVIPGFMIQGGDRLGTGGGDAGYYFKNETDPSLTFDVPGRLAMANAGPDTNSTQFFITELAVPELSGQYTIFGQCDPPSVQLVAAITHLPRNADDKPLKAVAIKKVTIVYEGQPIPPDPMPPKPPAAAPAAVTPSPATP